MWNLENIIGITIGGLNISNKRYADGTIFIADNEHDFQNLVDLLCSAELSETSTSSELNEAHTASV